MSQHRPIVPAVLIGLTATLTGVGLARFAYTPLIPAIVGAGWFAGPAAAYLGAANLLGYLVGALTGYKLSERCGYRVVLDAAFVGVALSFLFCAHAAPFAWFFFWRLVSGIGGGLLMVVGPSTGLTAVAPARRARVGTLIFMGVGLGALLSAMLIPPLLRAGLASTWLALGGLALTMGIIGDRAMTRLPVVANHATAYEQASHRGSRARLVVILVMLAYACDGMGFVPHTVFWVDYLAREVGLGMGAASFQWALFGLGGVLGPVVIGFAVSRFGWHRSLSGGFVIKCLAVGLPVLAVTPVARSISSILVGALVPGISALISGRLGELVGPIAHKRVWGLATAAFALSQAISGYGMSGLYAALGTYRPLFMIGSGVLALAFALILLSGRCYCVKKKMQ